MADEWSDVGSAEELQKLPLQQVMVGSTRVALSYRDGVFGAVSGVCNHAGGPLGKGALDGDYVVCPWHQRKFHRIEGHGESGFEEKVVGPIIMGGQDNIQAVAGQMMGFFGELGCQFPQFSYIAHSRGWSAEDMEKNVDMVSTSEALRQAAAELLDRCVDLAERLIATTPAPVPRAGRKGRALPLARE